ncbi:MAG TPA: hypothetical protein VMT56_00620 [Candidatus Bathyarchaeia archaeon]|nr:hypothetical protein [Candidatus Bathyarchaeia archaeon]
MKTPKWLTLASVLALSVINLVAQQCTTNYFINPYIRLCAPAAASIGDAACPAGTSWCGLSYVPSFGSTLSGNGFHGYTPGRYSSIAGIDSQKWLNANFPSITFQLCNSVSSPTSCYGQLAQNSSTDRWRAPYGTVANTSRFPGPYDTSCAPSPGVGYACDAGYYLVTTSTANPITIVFGSNIDVGNNQCTGCISEFSLFWGSADAWNSITFIDVNNHSTTYTGTNIFTGNINTQNNVKSYVYDFKLSPGQPAWKSVQFFSTSPAFELDNIAWVTNSCAIVGDCDSGFVSNAIQTPVPEPASGTFLVSAIIVAAAAIKFTTLR